MIIAMTCVQMQLAWAENYSPLESKNSLAVKVGYHIYQDSDFTDFYSDAAQALGGSFSSSDLNSYVLELAYERKFNRYIGIEAAFGYTPSSKTFGDVLESGDSLKLKLHNLYLAPSLKGHLPLGENFELYVGIGPDFDFTLGKIKYRESGNNLSGDDNLFGFGLHGLLGFEWYFYQNPDPDDYKASVGLFLEYKYSWVNVSGADAKVIDLANANLGTVFLYHDLNVGGHDIFGGLRWHF